MTKNNPPVMTKINALIFYKLIEATGVRTCGIKASGDQISVELSGFFATAYPNSFRCLVCNVHLIIPCYCLFIGNLDVSTRSASAVNMHLCQVQACLYRHTIIVFSKATTKKHPYPCIPASIGSHNRRQENHTGLNTTSHFPRTHLSDLVRHSTETSLHLLS